MEPDDARRERASIEDCETLWKRGRATLQQGNVQGAHDLCRRALETARQLGDPDLIDRAFCNLCAVEVAIGRTDQPLRELRAILSRSADRVNRRLAAYNLARIYECRKDRRKGLLYARIAREELRGLLAAGASVDTEWFASDHNQMGNFLVAESRFDEAAREYEEALLADRSGDALRRALIEQNLGYCYLMLGRMPEGMEMLYRALRVIRRSELLEDRLTAHLDLCFGHLELGRLRSASRHGSAALRLADQIGDSDSITKALYLLGETAYLAGEDGLAREHFGRLQDHFPQHPYLADCLIAVDLRKMINLRA